MDQAKLRTILQEILTQLLFFFGLFRAIIVFGLRGVFCPSNWLTITGPCKWFNVNLELSILAVVLILWLGLLAWEHAWPEFARACRSNWLVFVFIGLAGLSTLWSIQSNITLYEFIVLLSTSLIAIYIGQQYSLEKLIKSFTYFFMIIFILSLAFVFSPIPNLGIMSDPFYKGAWNGIFWHRNYLGCFSALGSTLFLINLLSTRKQHRGDFLINLLMLGIGLTLLIMSKSATGLISGMVLIGLVIVLYAWIKWGQKLKHVHYFAFLGAGAIVFTIVMAKLNFFLGLLGRNSSLTGRVPVWEYLLRNVVSQHSWLGYGYGAIWHLQGFCEELAGIFKWGYYVLIGDNGFIDILLHMGIVGLTLLFVLIILGFIRAIRYFLKERTLVAAFPVLVLIFGLVANISLSLILESETLLWIIALVLMVSIESMTHVKTLPSTEVFGK